MCDARGKISSGRKSEKGYPMSTDYFVCDAFKEITGLYGDQPKKLIIYMPSDDLYDFFDCNFQLYRSDKQKVRQCDGEYCRHILDETVNIKPKEGETELRIKSFEQGQVTACICNFMPETVPNPKKGGEPMKNPQLCSYGMSLKAFVANPVTLKPMTPQPIMFRSGSKNTGDTIFTELKRYPRYRGIPFELEVEIVRVGGNKFPVWKIRPYIDFESLITYQLEGAPVETGLRALPPPLAPVEDGQFNNEGEYYAGSEQVAGGRMQEEQTPSPAAPVLPLGKGEINSKIEDAEYREVEASDPANAGPAKSAGKSKVKNEKNVEAILECIGSFDDLVSLNKWWIAENMKKVVAEMNPKDRARVFEARDKRKLELKGMPLKSENEDDLPF